MPMFHKYLKVRVLDLRSADNLSTPVKQGTTFSHSALISFLTVSQGWLGNFMVLHLQAARPKPQQQGISEVSL